MAVEKLEYLICLKASHKISTSTRYPLWKYISPGAQALMKVFVQPVRKINNPSIFESLIISDGIRPEANWYSLIIFPLTRFRLCSFRKAFAVIYAAC